MGGKFFQFLAIRRDVGAGVVAVFPAEDLLEQQRGFIEAFGQSDKREVLRDIVLRLFQRLRSKRIKRRRIGIPIRPDDGSDLPVVHVKASKVFVAGQEFFKAHILGQRIFRPAAAKLVVAADHAFDRIAQDGHVETRARQLMMHAESKMSLEEFDLSLLVVRQGLNVFEPFFDRVDLVVAERSGMIHQVTKRPEPGLDADDARQGRACRLGNVQEDH